LRSFFIRPFPGSAAVKNGTISRFCYDVKKGYFVDPQMDEWPQAFKPANHQDLFLNAAGFINKLASEFNYNRLENQ